MPSDYLSLGFLLATWLRSCSYIRSTHPPRHCVRVLLSLSFSFSLCFPRTRGHVCDLSFSLSRSSSCTLGCTSLSRSLLSLSLSGLAGPSAHRPARRLALSLSSCSAPVGPLALPRALGSSLVLTLASASDCFNCIAIFIP